VRRVTRTEDHNAAIARATGFHVTRFLGRAQYASLGEHSTLDAARAARDADGVDEHGRRPMIYALVPGRRHIFVE
jgi:hypothetical protein